MSRSKPKRDGVSRVEDLAAAKEAPSTWETGRPWWGSDPGERLPNEEEILAMCLRRWPFADMIAKSEGLRGRPYYDKTGRSIEGDSAVGYVTIGIGRNLDADPLTRKESLMLLAFGLERREGDLRRRWPYFAKLDPARRAAVVDMAFNMGVPRFLGFKKTIAAIEAGDFQTAFFEIGDSTYFEKDVGRRAEDNMVIILTGKMPSDWGSDDRQLVHRLRSYQRTFFATALELRDTVDALGAIRGVARSEDGPEVA